MVAVTSLTAMSQTTLDADLRRPKSWAAAKRTLGWLLGASGVGALAGSLYLAARRTVLGLGRVIAVAGLRCWARR